MTVRRNREIVPRTSKRDLRLLTTVLVSAVCWSGTAIAQSTIRVNEVSFNRKPADAQWVELYNSGDAAEEVSGYVLTDEDGNDYMIPETLPPVPPGAFVVVYFDGLGNAADDIDFGDNVAVLHSEAGLSDPFESEGDQASLYLSDTFSPATIVSFVAWGMSPGNDAFNAVGGGLWFSDIHITGSGKH